MTRIVIQSQQYRMGIAIGSGGGLQTRRHFGRMPDFDPRVVHTVNKQNCRIFCAIFNVMQ